VVLNLLMLILGVMGITATATVAIYTAVEYYRDRERAAAEPKLKEKIEKLTEALNASEAARRGEQARASGEVVRLSEDLLLTTARELDAMGERCTYSGGKRRVQEGPSEREREKDSRDHRPSFLGSPSPIEVPPEIRRARELIRAKAILEHSMNPEGFYLLREIWTPEMQHRIQTTMRREGPHIEHLQTEVITWERVTFSRFHPGPVRPRPQKPRPEVEARPR
jgi:hypothetical protein